MIELLGILAVGAVYVGLARLLEWLMFERQGRY